jgi:hypothetical protein
MAAAASSGNADRGGRDPSPGWAGAERSPRSKPLANWQETMNLQRLDLRPASQSSPPAGITSRQRTALGV